MIATLIYLASIILGLLALAAGIAAALLGGVAVALATPDSAPIALPVRPAGIAAAALGILLFLDAANHLCGVMALS